MSQKPKVWFEEHAARIEHLQNVGIDPYGTDDTVFGVPVVHCDQHGAAHNVGWCTVMNVDKTPLEVVSLHDPQGAYDECKAKGLWIYNDPEENNAH